MSAYTPPEQMRADARREWKRARKATRRDVIIQCDRCGCSATGRINARGRLGSVNVPAELSAAGWTHGLPGSRDRCGGVLRPFDLEGKAS
jgi:hypothetical protein